MKFSFRKIGSLLIIFPLFVGCIPFGEKSSSANLTPSEGIIAAEKVETLTTPTPQGCQETQGHYKFHEIQMELMTHPLPFRVYLPVCYDPDGEHEYPVLYFLHGQSFNDDQWDRLGADETLDRLILAEEVGPFILVMPREADYMANHLDSKFGPALAEELVPWIDANYNTCAERECRAIGGISRGGAWAMRTGLIYWETFNMIGAHSFPPFRGDFNTVPFWLQEIPEEELPMIWIDIGVLDVNLDPAYQFQLRLTKYRIPNELHIYSGTHNEYYWETNLEDYLRWYAEGWKDIEKND